jgi:hypothetical protein
MSERTLVEFRERAEDLVVPPDLGVLHRRMATRRRSRGLALAAFAVSVLLVGAFALRGALVGHDDIEPAGPPRGVHGQGAEQVARDFLAAYAAFDADRAMAYLSDGPIDGHMGVLAPTEFRMRLDYYRAIGYRIHVTRCERGPTPTGTHLSCTFDLQALRSDELGLGPYRDNVWLLHVAHDGKIDEVHEDWAYANNGFAAQVWTPFARWLASTHPADVAVMYADADQTDERITPDSIRLWRQRTAEYVDHVRGQRG